MYTQMISAMSAMRTSQVKMDTISNNIANSETDGFKTRETSFGSILTQEFTTQPEKNTRAGALTPKNLRIGYGVQATMNRYNFAPGSPKRTDSEYDLYVNNDAFFQVSRNGTENLLTRKGDFQPMVNLQGQQVLATSSGDRVLNSQGQEIVIPADRTFKVEENGVVNLISKSNPDDVVVADRIPLFRVPNKQILEEVGESYYKPPETTTEVPANEISVLPGHLESSNVDMQKEMTSMIANQRSFEFGARALTTADEMYSLILGIGK